MLNFVAMIINPKDRQELRKWFEENSATEKEVYVHCIRKEHETLIPYLDVVEEALCFGWIDSTCRPCDGEGYLQRLSPRKKNSYWTELNKERCRRLIKLGLMTPAGKRVLPSLAKNSFKPEQWILDAVKADKEAWKNHKTFPPLYVRVRLYNVQWYKDHVSEERSLDMLQRYIDAAREGKMIGDWNDKGRLLDY